MKKTFLRSIAAFVLFTVVSSLLLNCARVVDDPLPVQSTQSDPIDEELMKAIEALPSSTYKLENLMLPNGSSVEKFLRENDPAFLDKQQIGGRHMSISGPQGKKNLLISRMQTVAYRLCNRNKMYAQGRYSTEPAQPYGLAYSYGQRDYRIRAVPPSGQCTMYSIYGLDCSGLIYNVLKESGYDPGTPIWADRIRKVTFWEELLKKDPDLAQVKVKDLGQIPLEQFQPGDLIYWKPTLTGEAKHIGIVLLDEQGHKAIFQSNGTSETAGNCSTNFGEKRGCRQISINAVTWKNGFGKVWGIVRIITDITGKWEMQLKCDWAEPTNIAAKFTIEFKMSENDNAVTGKGTGVDYDGTPMNIEFKGSYDQANNVLKGRFYFSFPDGELRQDDLSVTLKQDDTGFVSLTNVVRGQGACIAQARLINRTSTNGRIGVDEGVKMTRQNL